MFTSFQKDIKYFEDPKSKIKNYMTVIRVDNLSKKYVIAHQQDSYKTFRGAITDAVKSIVRAINPRA